MESSELLVGNVAIASVIIKTIMSSIRLVFPNISDNATVIRGVTMIMGIIAAIAMDVELFTSTHETMLLKVLQKTFSGLFIGATAIGVHESTKEIQSTTQKVLSK